MPLIPCARCGQHHLRSDARCPHCGAGRVHSAGRSRAALALGLGLAGCATTTALYGVEVTDTSFYADVDGDGFSQADGDCNDADDAVFPGAPELPGDGVDSDCDGEDDPVEDTGA
jgi:hypothetical protein